MVFFGHFGQYFHGFLVVFGWFLEGFWSVLKLFGGWGK